MYLTFIDYIWVQKFTIDIFVICQNVLTSDHKVHYERDKYDFFCPVRNAIEMRFTAYIIASVT